MGVGRLLDAGGGGGVESDRGLGELVPEPPSASLC